MAIATMIALTVASIAVSVTASAVQSQQQNAQIKYQQEVMRQNQIAAKNKADAEMIRRKTEASRQQAAARAKMAQTGVDSTSGSFLDLIGQGATASEMDVLKAKYDGDADAWTLNNKINELETQKSNTALNATLSGIQAGISTASKFNWSSAAGSAASGAEAIGKTSGNSGFVGVDAMEGTVA